MANKKASKEKPTRKQGEIGTARPDGDGKLLQLTIGKDLNLQQELFCRYYTQNEHLFRNGTLAYAEAYNHDLDSLSRNSEQDEKGMPLPRSSEYDKAYDMCASNASRLLKMDKIQRRITELLNELMRDDVIDSQLVKIIMQDKELRPKVAAISEFNKLRGRITERHQHAFEGLSDEALAERLAEIVAGSVGDPSGTPDQADGKPRKDVRPKR